MTPTSSPTPNFLLVPDEGMLLWQRPQSIRIYWLIVAFGKSNQFHHNPWKATVRRRLSFRYGIYLPSVTYACVHEQMSNETNYGVVTWYCLMLRTCGQALSTNHFIRIKHPENYATNI